MDRAGLLGGVTVRSIETEEDSAMSKSALELAIEKDISNGLHPFFVRSRSMKNNVQPFSFYIDCGYFRNHKYVRL